MKHHDWSPMPLLIFPPPFLAATDWARLFADKLQQPPNSQPPCPSQPQERQRPHPKPQPPDTDDEDDEDRTVVPIRKPS